MSYAETDEVKAWLDVTDTRLDALIDLAIPAAEAWINGYCHRSFDLTAATARYYDTPLYGPLYVDDIGDPTVTIATDDTLTGAYATSWAATDFQLLPRNQGFDVRPWYQIVGTGTRTFPPQSTIRTGLIKVTARWGWPQVPDAVRQACVMQAARIVKRRGSPEGVAGFNDFGVVRINTTDRDIEALLSDFRLVTVA